MRITTKEEEELYVGSWRHQLLVLIVIFETAINNYPQLI